MPITRPLWLTTPHDPEAWGTDDEYTLGTDILVAPVLQPGRGTRSLYLPAGVWRDYWIGTNHTGPGWITVPAPLDQIPLLIRAGTDPGLPSPNSL